MKENTLFDKEAGILLTDSFDSSYPFLSHKIVVAGEMVDSRGGYTKEFLNFSTKIRNPRKRCVGGFYRDINIFFLLAEALWIFAGRKDVAFLDIFNSRMKQFSDDEKTFHAPYGFRLRHYGVSSFDKGTEENKHSLQGVDQIEKAIKMLSDDHSTRQCVLSIWNADLDLGAKTKDIPCNDLLLIKVRKNKLYLTIANRSNDLHWGLPTNIFQFSFLNEVMCLILKMEMGQQVHYSQSLHAYVQNPLTTAQMAEFTNSTYRKTIYDLVEPSKMDFKFVDSSPLENLQEIDHIISKLLSVLQNYHTGEYGRPELFAFHSLLKNKSTYFTLIFELLQTYIDYKKTKKTVDDKLAALEAIVSIRRRYAAKNVACADFILLAMNYFVSRLPKTEESFVKETIFNTEVDQYIGKL